MMRRLIMFLPCFWLACCDKPGHSEKHDEVAAPPAQPSRQSHAARSQNGSKPDELRTILEEAAAIESSEAREKALAELAWSVIETDPQLAMEALLKLPAGSAEKIRLIQHHALRLAEQNVDETLAWAATLGNEDEIAAAIGQVALVLAETDPQRAANLLSESGIVGREFDVTLVQVVQRWAAQSAPEAAAWTALFPPGQAREASLKIIAGSWLPKDPAAAFSWMAGLENAELRRETARALEGIILQQPQATREEWLQHADTQIRSELEQQRKEALKDVGDNIPENSR